MSAAIAQFAGRPENVGLYFGRVEEFGLPYRGRPPEGPAASVLSHSVEVCTFCAAWFDPDLPGQLAAYVDLMNHVEVGWYRLKARVLFKDGKRHYLEWVVPVLAPDPRYSLGANGLPQGG